MGFDLPLLNNFCCGCTLRTGTKIIGWFNLITGIIFTVLLLAFIYVEDSSSTEYKASMPFIIIEVVTCIIQTVTSFILLMGAYEGKKKLVGIWVIANTAIVCINTILWIINIFQNDFSLGEFSILFMFVELYLLWVVYSYYRDMSDLSTYTV